MNTKLLVTGALALAAAAVTPLAAQKSTAAGDLPRVVNVKALDFKFDAPASIPSGTTTFRLTNVGKEPHHLWIVKLTDGKTPADFNKAMKSWGSALKMPAWAIDVGGPNTAGANETAEGTMTLEPGTYMLVCWIPSPDGMLHVMKGMVKPLTVTGPALAATEPTADITMMMDDYTFELSKPITPGRHTIRFENRAAQAHEAVIAQLLPDKTLAQTVTWLNGGQAGPEPVVLLGGASGLAKGRHMFITADFQPGHYALLCFIPDAKDGKPHFDHGMAKEIIVAP
jgi:plastocyanin